MPNILYGLCPSDLRVVAHPLKQNQLVVARDRVENSMAVGFTSKKVYRMKSSFYNNLMQKILGGTNIAFSRYALKQFLTQN